MNIKVLSFGCIALTASMAQAVDFPKAGGDLASADDWGGAVPGSTDDVVLPQSGDYTLSDNVSFKSLKTTGVENALDLSEKTLSLGGDFVVAGSTWAHSGTNLIANGTIRVTGTGSRFRSVNYTSKTENLTVLTNVVFDTEGGIDAIRMAKGSKVSIYDSTLTVAGSFVIARDGSVATYDHMNPIVEIVDSIVTLGSSGSLYFEMSNEDCGHSESVLSVRGAKASLSCSGTADTMLCFRGSGDQMLISDRATVSLPKSNISTGKGDSKICVESGASLTASFYTASTNGSNNEFRVTSGATAAISKFRFSTSGNTLVIDNATYDMGTAADRSFTLAAAANCSSNVVVIRGAQAQAPLMADASSYNLNIFGAGHDNALVLENGAVWDPGSVETFMKSCTNSAFIVRGSGTEFGAAANRFYTGSRYNVGDVASRNNRIEISDGATFKASRFCVQGIGTEVVVSNATLEVDSPSNESFGLRLGFAATGASLTTNNMMVLRGESPQVKVTGNPADTWQCRVSDGSTLRFEVPETGYSTVPLTAECPIVVVGTSKIEIDCADFCEKTGGKVQLMHSDADIPQTTQDVLARVALPEGARIIVDGGDVYLKSPRHQGLILMVR